MVDKPGLRMMRPTVDVSGTSLEPPPGLDPDCQMFLGDPAKRTYSLFGRWWLPVTCTLAFGGGSLFVNYVSRLPFRAGIHKHILMALFGAAFGEASWNFRMKYTAERDIQYYHYMILHPEDFQAPERKKWGETIQPWIPFR